MVFNTESAGDGREVHPADNVSERPSAYRVNENSDLKEEDLEKSFLFAGDAETNDAETNKPVKEGTGVGGEKFGQDNNTPSGNDKNNPTQYAGNTNSYFARTEPSEEHPEDSNFTAKDQDGSPDYDKAQPSLATLDESPKPEKVEKGDGENDRPHPQETYQEGTADNDEANLAGYEEVPDQLKVGEDVSDEEFKEDHEEK
jgi:hypothetical protein